MSARADDPGLLTPAETSLLTDQYELAMAASYFKRGMNAPAVFELFARHLPPHRHWLLAAGIGPALALVERMRFGERELSYLAQLGFAEPFLGYLEGFRFTGDVDAVPEGTVAFAGEPLVRVTGPRIEAQLLETLLLNQVNFQTAIATKAARVVLAIPAPSRCSAPTGTRAARTAAPPWPAPSPSPIRSPTQSGSRRSPRSCGARAPPRSRVAGHPRAGK